MSEALPDIVKHLTFAGAHRESSVKSIAYLLRQLSYNSHMLFIVFTLFYESFNVSLVDLDDLCKVGYVNRSQPVNLTFLFESDLILLISLTKNYEIIFCYRKSSLKLVESVDSHLVLVISIDIAVLSVSVDKSLEFLFLVKKLLTLRSSESKVTHKSKKIIITKLTSVGKIPVVKNSEL